MLLPGDCAPLGTSGLREERLLGELGQTSAALHPRMETTLSPLSKCCPNSAKASPDTQLPVLLQCVPLSSHLPAICRWVLSNSLAVMGSAQPHHPHSLHALIHDAQGIPAASASLPKFSNPLYRGASQSVRASMSPSNTPEPAPAQLHIQLQWPREATQVLAAASHSPATDPISHVL